MHNLFISLSLSLVLSPSLPLSLPLSLSFPPLAPMCSQSARLSRALPRGTAGGSSGTALHARTCGPRALCQQGAMTTTRGSHIPSDKFAGEHRHLTRVRNSSKINQKLTAVQTKLEYKFEKGNEGRSEATRKEKKPNKVKKEAYVRQTTG